MIYFIWVEEWLLHRKVLFVVHSVGASVRPEAKVHNLITSR